MSRGLCVSRFGNNRSPHTIVHPTIYLFIPMFHVFVCAALIQRQRRRTKNANDFYLFYVLRISAAHHMLLWHLIAKLRMGFGSMKNFRVASWHRRSSDPVLIDNTMILSMNSYVLSPFSVSLGFGFDGKFPLKLIKTKNPS